MLIKFNWSAFNLEKFVINGGNRLSGEISISGAKNAAVAILPAVILSNEPCIIENIPNISDVTAIIKILHHLGAEVKAINKSTYVIDSRGINTWVLPVELASNMRASSYFIGAFLGRFKKASVAPPGGCDFGVRPIDQHIKGFEALGAKVTIENGMVEAKAEELVGTSVYLDKVSVGATVNIMLAAAKADGFTVIENAAKEPHIVDLANFLNSMGADIMGAGTDVIKIHGVKYLRGTTYSVIPDQIEAGTYMTAVAATGGNVIIKNVIPKHLESISTKLIEIGCKITEYDEAIHIVSDGKPKACTVITQPHPGFPTDMQPQITTLLSVAEGTSIVSEGVWDNRFRYVNQLLLMNANITVDGKMAVVKGVKNLTGAKVEATDLRAGAAMIIAGLIAKGTTTVSSIKYIDRGYEDIVQKLSAVGADIKRVTEKESSLVEDAV